MMRILALETVDSTGSVAALEDQRVIAEQPLDARQRSAQSLAPGIAQLLERVGWRAADVELVAVATGPGSFTGLRIGVTTAKVFAYAVGCQVIGVHTLLAIASRAPADAGPFSVVLDAQRNELFVADFSRRADGELVEQDTTRVVACQAWVESLPAGAVVTGPGLAKITEQVLTKDMVVLDPALWAPTAGVVGAVGWRLFSAGQRTEVFDLLPQYFRRTAAEEQWDRKQAGPKPTG
jgi:tRNA threonylcarbamoyladenosine biosynthesis protein TsaB